MADTVRTTWLYPVNWDGSYPGAGNPSPPDQWHGWKRMKVQFTNVSDGTGESSVIKLRRGDFRGVQGSPCTKIGIECISYSAFGMSVRLEWDMNPVQICSVLPETNSHKIHGPFYPDVTDDTTYGEGETGDLLLTTIAHSSNDSYNIIMDIIIKE
jgi:hypothetical protein